MEVLIQEDTTAHLLKLLLACELDFVLASRPILDPRLEVRDLFTEALLLALPPGHALADKPPARAADLRHERLIVMKEGHCLGQQTLNFCERRDLRPAISFRSAQLETILSLVGAGLGVALVPEMAAHSGRRGGLETRPFQAPRPERTIVTVWPQKHPPGRAAAEFLKRLADSPARLALKRTGARK